jgi:hypothetical protein
MAMRKIPALVIVILTAAAMTACAEAVARITLLEGSVGVMRKGSDQWRDAKPSMPLNAGDALYTREESFAEIRYAIGTVLRMDEKTKITLEASSEKTLKTRSAVGDVWVNMKKLLSKGKEFEVSTPTAVAAIRGTVFRIKSNRDSSAEVDVYDGKVAVGPSDELRQKMHPVKPAGSPEKPVEVSGPEEIPGPFEVPLTQWRDIVAGQKIEVRPDGTFKLDKFDRAAAAEKFIKRNEALDRELVKEQ